MAATGRRYAQAAFELAKENNLDRWSEDLARVTDVLGDSDVLEFLDAPQVTDSAKLDGIGKLLSDIDVLVRNTVNLMTVNRDISKFADMFRVFNEMSDEQHGIARAEVVTAVPLDDSQRAQIAAGLAKLVGRSEVVVTESVDSEIIGGVVAKVGDRLIDGSTRTQLRAMRDSLAERPVD
ncbi:MAG TPA: ATP synthase F1 subunit delta [Dehalococcoidia bacterium]|jgi:F-type H+-transporting ATPase subunit delta|nr:ATP synthase F1 subunit delta [Dehalococcoidia bacterium]HIK89511.1 ATP synthase F1 subunit delta [Dehalococcoidia bacterium]